MAKARDRTDWNHTASILAMLVNSNPWRKGDAALPSDFNLYAPKRKSGGGLSLKDVKCLFVKPA
jgi:hypothetical protein